MTADILVPLDGSALAERALPLQAALARVTCSGIALIRAVPPPASDEPMEAWEEELLTARNYLYGIGRQLETGGLHVRTEIVEGYPATVIADYAERNPSVWLISVATRHGHHTSRSWPFGSVAERILHTARKPVLLLRPTQEAAEAARSEPALHTIVVPLDGSAFAEEALELARRIALLTRATLVLVSVIPPPNNMGVDQVEFVPISVHVSREYEKARLARYLARTAEQARSEGLEVVTRIAYGHPAETILLTAAKLHADLIIIAASGRRDLERVWLGSVAQKLVRGSHVPILLLRTPGLRAELVADDYQLAEMQPVAYS